MSNDCRIGLLIYDVITIEKILLFGICGRTFGVSGYISELKDLEGSGLLSKADRCLRRWRCINNGLVYVGQLRTEYDPKKFTSNRVTHISTMMIKWRSKV